MLILTQTGHRMRIAIGTALLSLSHLLWRLRLLLLLQLQLLLLLVACLLCGRSCNVCLSSVANVVSRWLSAEL